ncbi:MAG TPA: hypothetical protein VHO67_09325 [Polyangia bacterium]|nr:hypothetical protein [Polyangia bacterium]
MTKALRPFSTAALATLLSTGCYSATPLRVQVQSHPPAASCVQTTDRVFADAGFERVRTVWGPDMFYTPRTRPGTSVALDWGIGAWLSHDDPDACSLTIEAISADPGVSRTRTFSGPHGELYDATDPEISRMRPFSVQRGEPFDAAVRDMARRLEVAFQQLPARAP